MTEEMNGNGERRLTTSAHLYRLEGMLAAFGQQVSDQNHRITVIELAMAEVKGREAYSQQLVHEFREVQARVTKVELEGSREAQEALRLAQAAVKEVTKMNKSLAKWGGALGTLVVVANIFAPWLIRHLGGGM